MLLGTQKIQILPHAFSSQYSRLYLPQYSLQVGISAHSTHVYTYPSTPYRQGFQLTVTVLTFIPTLVLLIGMDGHLKKIFSKRNEKLIEESIYVVTLQSSRYSLFFGKYLNMISYQNIVQDFRSKFMLPTHPETDILPGGLSMLQRYAFIQKDLKKCWYIAAKCDK